MPQFNASVRASIPEDWWAKESITLVSPDGRANVISSSEPVQEGLTTQQYSETQGELLANEFPNFRLLKYETAKIFGTHDGYFRHFEWAPPDAEPVMQYQIYLVLGSRGYTATATTPSATSHLYDADLLRVLAGLRIDGGA